MMKGTEMRLKVKTAKKINQKKDSYVTIRYRVSRRFSNLGFVAAKRPSRDANRSIPPSTPPPLGLIFVFSSLSSLWFFAGLVHVGDELREVNGVSVVHKRPDEISQLLVSQNGWTVGLPSDLNDSFFVFPSSHSRRAPSLWRSSPPLKRKTDWGRARWGSVTASLPKRADLFSLALWQDKGPMTPREPGSSSNKTKWWRYFNIWYVNFLLDPGVLESLVRLHPLGGQSDAMPGGRSSLQTWRHPAGGDPGWPYVVAGQTSGRQQPACWTCPVQTLPGEVSNRAYYYVLSLWPKLCCTAVIHHGRLDVKNTVLPEMLLTFSSSPGGWHTGWKWAHSPIPSPPKRLPVSFPYLS